MIYADHAATTAVSPAVIEAMQPFWGEIYGNPSSLYRFGQRARTALEDARARVAVCIHALPEEIQFTSGGSEANNTALNMLLSPDMPKRLLYSALEHPSIRRTAQQLAARGVDVTEIPAEHDGRISPETLAELLAGAPMLVSVMMANNELGTIQPIAELAQLCHAQGGLFHTDAVQAVGQIPIDVQKIDVDMLSASGHKFHAPKGIGFLYVRTGCSVPPLIFGGGQERGLRAGTENVAYAVGMATALEEACGTQATDTRKIALLRDRLWASLRDLRGVRVNGSMTHRLPGNLDLTFDGVEGEALVSLLDLHGICVSAGSACCAGSVTASPVLKAIGLTDSEAAGALRITLGAENTVAEVDTIAAEIRFLYTQLTAHQ